MLIDWFTVSAQAVNFLILVWLLKRFLYKPILHAIDEREKRIAGQLQEAASKKAEAQKESDDFRHKNEKFDQQRGSLLSKAEDEAKVERQKLLGEARKEFETLRAKLKETLRAEQDSVRRELNNRTQQEVFAIARKTLADLAAASLEERVTDVFLRRLRELDEEEKGRFTSSLKAARHPAMVRSAFELPPAQRAAIEKAVKETLAADTQVQFETASELVSGIELTTDGHKVAWSIAEYLSSLEQSIGELLKEKEKTEPNAESQSGTKAEFKADESKPVQSKQ